MFYAIVLSFLGTHTLKNQREVYFYLPLNTISKIQILSLKYSNLVASPHSLVSTMVRWTCMLYLKIIFYGAELWVFIVKTLMDEKLSILRHIFIRIILHLLMSWIHFWNIANVLWDTLYINLQLYAKSNFQ